MTLRHVRLARTQVPHALCRRLLAASILLHRWQEDAGLILRLGKAGLQQVHQGHLHIVQLFIQFQGELLRKALLQPRSPEEAVTLQGEQLHFEVDHCVGIATRLIPELLDLLAPEEIFF